VVWSELKRRNVAKAALAYAAIGWLLIEVSSAIFPIYKAPDWVLQVRGLLEINQVAAMGRSYSRSTRVPARFLPCLGRG
jgi:hypothetical protein